MYEPTHGYTFGTPLISAKHSLASYPSLLKKAGYHTGFIGMFGVAIRQEERKQMFDPIGRGPYFKKQPDGSLRHET